MLNFYVFGIRIVLYQPLFLPRCQESTAPLQGSCGVIVGLALLRGGGLLLRAGHEKGESSDGRKRKDRIPARRQPAHRGWLAGERRGPIDSNFLATSAVVTYPEAAHR